MGVTSAYIIWRDRQRQLKILHAPDVGLEPRVDPGFFSRLKYCDPKGLMMLVEERIYTIAAGKLPIYLDLYTNGPLDLQKRILGNLLGYFTSEIGALSTLVHLWGYASFEDRTARRAALAAEPEWQNYLSAVTPLIVKMENRLLLPTAFSPIR